MSEGRTLQTQFAPLLHALLQSGRHGNEGGETVEEAKALLEDAVAAGASDVHLDPHRRDYRLRFRIDGAVHDVGALPRAQGERVLRLLRAEAEMDPLRPFEPQDGHMRRRICGNMWDMRLSTAPTCCGEKMVIRLLNRESLERRIGELGMAPHTLERLRHWLEDSVGMALVVGPTGSGKTTTLYALLHELKMRQRSIVTIEDPVEFEVEGITQIQVKEDVGLTFAAGLKAMLRLDPDYLMVGELRDEESAHAAIDAAGAGHLLLCTLHSRDAVGAVTMLRNYGIEDHKIAAALELVVAQRLVRRLCVDCRAPAVPDDGERAWLRRHGLDAPAQCWKATGCKACNGTGYRGRLGVFELWRINEEFERLILRRADELALRRQYLSRSHLILQQDGLEKVAAGETSLAEVRGMRAGPHGYLLRRDGEEGSAA